MNGDTTTAATPATIHGHAERAQRALTDACFRLELLTNNRTYEISELARQVLKDLSPVVIGLDHIEQASAPARNPNALRDIQSAVARVAHLLESLDTHPPGSAERKAACAEMNTTFVSTIDQLEAIEGEVYAAMGDDAPAAVERETEEAPA